MAAQLNVPADWLTKQWEFYCKELKRLGRYDLMIWVYHCLLGGDGHRLAGIIEEAIRFHSFARGARNDPEIKGGNPFTEHYSIFGPEVRTRWDNGDPLPNAQKNEKLFGTLVNNDVVIIAGQAKSHCVAWTIDDFLRDILARDKKLAKKVYLMEDCTSSVVIPGVVDFTDQADAKFAEFADKGMNLVKSTDPIESWPGMEEILARLDE
jgi:nicotinamidase-related amidase